MSIVRYSLIVLFGLFGIYADNVSTTTTSIFDEYIADIRQMEKDFKRDDEQLKIDRKNLSNEKQLTRSIQKTDVIQLNVGGEIMFTTRETLTSIPKSLFSILFNGQWEQHLQRDKDDNFLVDFNPILFRHLLDQLQLFPTNPIALPQDPLLSRSFKKILRKFNLQHLLSSAEKAISTININGQLMTTQTSNLRQISNSTKDNIFIDNHPKFFRHFLQLQRQNKSLRLACRNNSFSKRENSFMKQMFKNWKIFCLPNINLSIETKWDQHAITVAAGNARGQELNQLFYPRGIYIDDDRTTYVADQDNHRIIKWKQGATTGRILAGGNGRGNREDQLNRPVVVIIDYYTDSLIIADYGNRRVMRWPRRNAQTGEILISNVQCSGLALGSNGELYVADDEKDEVQRWKIGDSEGVLVAGGNERGDQLNQLNQPRYIFVDEHDSIYISDYSNHRVVKWTKGAREGTIVAGGHGYGNSLTQLNRPNGIFVDQFESIFVADSWNNRVVRWLKGSNKGEILVGGNGEGNQSNQFNIPVDLSFDEDNNLYIVEYGNHRVQKFSSIEL